MNPIGMYLIQLAVTLLACLLLTAYLRTALRRVLVDLCRTRVRAQFWSSFANILLILLPVVFGMGYRPGIESGNQVFFDIARRIQGNLAGFLLAMAVIGAVVSFFALVAPRPQVRS